jgi:hypothetical protein
MTVLHRVFVRVGVPVALALLGQPTLAGQDPATGLVIAPGWELVRAHCGACHSYRLVTAQRGDEQFWLTTIRWMQRTQKLWPIEAAQEATLVAYLGEHYNETEWGRRPALDPDLLPVVR